MVGTVVLQKLDANTRIVENPHTQRQANTVWLSPWRFDLDGTNAPCFSFSQSTSGIRTEYTILPEQAGVRVVCKKYGNNAQIVHAEEVIYNNDSVVEIGSDGGDVRYVAPSIRRALPAIVSYFQRSFCENVALPVKNPHDASVALRTSERLIPALETLVRHLAA